MTRTGNSQVPGYKMRITFQKAWLKAHELRSSRKEYLKAEGCYKFAKRIGIRDQYWKSKSMGVTWEEFENFVIETQRNRAEVRNSKELE